MVILHIINENPTVHSPERCYLKQFLRGLRKAMSEQTHPTSQTSSALRPVDTSRRQDILYFFLFCCYVTEWRTLPRAGERRVPRQHHSGGENLRPPRGGGGLPPVGGAPGRLGLRHTPLPASEPTALPLLHHPLSVPLYKTISSPPSSDHVGVLVLQLVQLLALLPQEQDPGGG